MRVLILTCNTGGGHNAVAAALKESFESRGAGCDVMDGLGFISKKASKFVSKWHTRFYRRYPELYKAGYMSAEKDQGMDRRDGPVYRYIARGARRLGRTIYSGGYGAVVCVHVIPAMMMTALKQSWRDCPVFCFVATDYTCSPTVGACTPDICVIPHEELTEEFVACGIDRESILPAGIPVRRVFREQGDRAAARKALGLPAEGRHIVLMSGSIGCGPMGDVAEELDVDFGKVEFETLNGYLTSLLGHIPTEKDLDKEIVANGYRFKILSLGNKTIGKVRAEKIKKETKGEETCQDIQNSQT